MDKHYQNLVFTTHALDRLKLRTISQDQVQQVLSHPEKTFPSDKPDQIKFIRTLNQRTIHVVAKHLNDQNKWLIVSVWVRGEDDPIPLTWKIITFPFKIIAKIANIILSYIKKYWLEKKIL
ncbi:DUF4258 domain-containing protein [Patescibacteria group bacterium]|nr:DUF4258 domain-containing protein [Patescibacteria group bacterium]MBU1885375.1 DUF4258 domain-containing protein [Patescibacteria group bacterium]